MRRPRTGLLVLGGLVAVSLVGLWRLRTPTPPPPPAPTAQDDDPRLTLPTPFRNVRPDVAYVGDAACRDCHRGVSEAYARHPMSRSLAPVAAMTAVERYEAEARNPFERLGSHFEVERRGDRMIHRETRRGWPVKFGTSSSTSFQEKS